LTVLPSNISARETGDPAQTVLVLQGGGALGAYQGGVYEALEETGCRPDWIAGISIGAINAAIIAGNAPGDCIGAMRRFWTEISRELTYPIDDHIDFVKRPYYEASALFVAMAGVPGFFAPRIAPLLPDWPANFSSLGYYDTSPLRKTLLDYVDFDRINRGDTRFSIGAVNVRTGNFAYFDNRDRKIGPEHVMASGALPPGFPPVEIDGEWYWDGGIVSNTPLQYILDNRSSCEMTIFQVDLFSANGMLPETMREVAQREKDIRYSSRTRLNTDLMRELQKLRAAAKRLAEKVPEELRGDEDLAVLLSNRARGPVAVMHLINRCGVHDSSSKDYNFSRAAVIEHWREGYEDARESLGHPDWTSRRLMPDEITTFDLTASRRRAG